MKTIIKRNLPINEKYDFLGITDMGEGNFNTCNNCGKLIRYVAELRSSNNKKYYVGTECAKTLSQCQINNEFSMLEQFNAMKKVATATNLIQNGSNIKIWGFDDKSTVYIAGLNSKDTVKKITIEKQFDPLLGSEYEFINTFLDSVFNDHNVIIKDWCFYDIEQYLKTLK
jgi:hypothetical protein